VALSASARRERAPRSSHLRLIGIELDYVEAVEVELVTVVRIERGKIRGREFMVKSDPETVEVRVLSVETGGGRRRRLSDLSRDARRRLRTIARLLIPDAWLEPQL